MTSFRLVLRSLVYHARAHLGATLGTAVASAVLVGALAVGDSVRATLERLALLRLGRTEVALASGDRLFRSDLFGTAQGPVTQVQPGPLQMNRLLALAPVLHLPAVAVASDSTARANQVNLFGVDARFWTLAPTSTPPLEIPSNQVVLNEALAHQLRVKPGDEVLFRVRKPSTLSQDAPLSPEEETAVALRLPVARVLSDTHFGRFSLAASQLPPLNAFVSLSFLQTRVEAPGRANLMLAAPPALSSVPAATVFVGTRPQSAGPLTNILEFSERMLRQYWQPADAELEWREVPESGVLELRSRRVFLDPPLAETVLAPPGPTNAFATQLAQRDRRIRVHGLLTYFVNELRVGDRATPYSMVTAAGSPLTPADLGDEEILINPWLADDLGAKPGDTLTLKYYVVGTLRQLEERSATFRVRGVYPMDAHGVDRHLMPDFPGLTDAENCRDWDTGLPIQTERIREKDEQYWRDYRGTPKALINLAAGQRLWANRFGNLTAIRFDVSGLPSSSGAPPVSPASVSGGPRTWVGVGPAPAGVVRSLRGIVMPLLQSQLDPAWFGLTFQPVRAQALAASTESQDFGQLFLGFSFFLVVAALLLVVLLFQFGVEQRATEIGTYLALGFRPAQVRRLLVAEGGLAALVGTLIGAWGGLFYARAMLHGLDTVWNQAVGGASLTFHVAASTWIVGTAAAFCLSLVVMAVTLRRQSRRSARELLASGAELERVGDLHGAPDSGLAQRAKGRGRPILTSGRVGLALAVAAVGLVAAAFLAPDTSAAGLFFGAGALLLLAGWALSSAWMAQLASTAEATRLSRRTLGLRNVLRRRRRSLAVIALLSSGSFLVAAVGAFRLDAVRDADRRDSGTGGFALIGQSTGPVIHDLNQPAGQETYGLRTNALAEVAVVPFRVRDGEDASCLNLNRAQRPRLVGVDPRSLAQRGAFTFAAVDRALAAPTNAWLLLEAALPPREPTSRTSASALPAASGQGTLEIPAIGDQASIVWALGKKVGDTVPYTDEQGRTFQLRLVAALANSVLQGNLVISESHFTQRFPSTSGYRMFLVDAPSNRQADAAAELMRGLADQGLELTPTVERLAAFNAVQNTYLGTFQVLGGLGLLLGSFGLGVVVLRNVLERRGELGLLQAVGWRPAQLRRLVLAEHTSLLGVGLVCGVGAALVAVLPSLLRPGLDVPYASLAATLLVVLANGLLWTWLATRFALRGRLIDQLRN